MKLSERTPWDKPEEPEASAPPIRISELSVWTDFVWRLDNTTPGQTNRIFWDYPLPDGSRSTDGQNRVLLESFREVSWGMLSNGGLYGRTLSVGSANQLSTGAKELFCWMNYRGFSNFGELTEDAWKQYHADIPMLLLNRKRFYADEHNLYGSTEVDYQDFQDDDGLETGYAADDDDDGSESEETFSAEQSQDTEPQLNEDDKITYGQVSARIKIAYQIYA